MAVVGVVVMTAMSVAVALASRALRVVEHGLRHTRPAVITLVALAVMLASLGMLQLSGVSDLA